MCSVLTLLESFDFVPYTPCAVFGCDRYDNGPRPVYVTLSLVRRLPERDRQSPPVPVARACFAETKIL